MRRPDHAVGSPALRATFDPPNFVQCGVRPFSEAYGPIRPYLAYLQVKDALAATGQVVSAGQGRAGAESPPGPAVDHLAVTPAPCQPPWSEASCSVIPTTERYLDRHVSSSATSASLAWVTW